MSNPASCSVLTLNVEGQKHLAEVTALLQRLQPEVVCLQEVFKVDLPHLAASLGAVHWQFVPMVLVDRENGFGMAPAGEWGLALLSRLPTSSPQVRYYLGDPSQPLPRVNDQNENAPHRIVIWWDVQVGEKWLRVAATHFTWSPQATFIPLQAQSWARLSTIYTNEIKQGLLCGDFNFPRGGELYRQFTRIFTDHIPLEVTTTLDQKLHRVENLQLVVDYIFTTGPYTVTDVQLHSGVSDHLGISGRLQLRQSTN